MASDLFPDTLPTNDAPPDDVETIARVWALLWSYRTRTTVLEALRLLGLKRADGRAFTAEAVKEALQVLRAREVLIEHPRRQGFYRLVPAMRRELYRDWLTQWDWNQLESVLLQLVGVRHGSVVPSYLLQETDTVIALMRFYLLGGAPTQILQRMVSVASERMGWHELMKLAVLDDFDAELFSRINVEWRWMLVLEALGLLTADWDEAMLPVAEWALDMLESKRDPSAGYVVFGLAEWLLLRGERKRALALLEGVDSGAVQALRGFALAQEGQWPAAQEHLEVGIKSRQKEVNARKRVLPIMLAWVYPLTLLAQSTPQHFQTARKFCLSEAGTRAPSPFYGWGLWTHAIAARLGDETLNAEAYLPKMTSDSANLDALWRLLLAAWLGSERLKLKPEALKNLHRQAEKLRSALKPCGLIWLVEQVDAALAVLDERAPPAGFFIGAREERWRDVLAALQALGGETQPAEDGAEKTRMVWWVDIGNKGEVKDIACAEQKRGPRGWSKAKPVSLAKVAADAKLPPWDAKVARAIRTPYGPRSATLDRAAAIQALIGHPAVALMRRPEQLVELVEGVPEIEVVKQGERFTFQVTPQLREQDDGLAYYANSDDRREAEALRQITVREDGPQRLSVVRLSPAQRRAAQLLAGKLEIPASEEAVLRQTLQALSAHFQVHADHVQAAREVASESRLRAELSPAGDGLQLRLVVAPLGEAGPRLNPGVGRRRLMAAIDGEAVGAARDLAREQAHVEAVLDALPFLEDYARADDMAEWLVSDPEHALALVETLSHIEAVAALDWPKGKPVRVFAVDSPQLSVSLHAERDWFRVGGQARLDEGLVLGFSALLDAARGQSRFVALGEGRYAALTQALRERLRDLAAVLENDKHGARLPPVAVAWADEALQGMQVESDAVSRAAIERLARAQEKATPLPSALQATLRPYQEDGFVWASRLAEAGFGACLADDMGLGKTLQALALLLARAEGGPALVIAPTSVCGNWMSEALRFAPSLNLYLYGAGDRETVLKEAAAFDVVIVSYTLLQQAGEAFATRRWHTVIADEAQAIKNAAAKRSQAVFELQSDFRLALSGTPVENRLAELWSIMRFVNPGLLGTLPKFNERFATRIERDRDRQAQHLLRRLIGPFLLRRTKAQVLQELPPRTEQVIEIEADGGEAAHYEALRREAVREAEQAMASGASAGQARMNILAQLTRLRRAACDPRLVTPAFAAEGAKVRAFAELAAELTANGHKALVFSQFVDFLALLRAPLDAAGISYQYLDGATPAAERTRRVAAFQAGEGDLFLISLKAGGFGLNLTAADYVVIADPWWNPAAEDQAMGRAHRMGQQRPVTVYRLVGKGTLEEQIVGMHQDKRALAESILSEGDAAALPSTEELMALIRG